jgi:hypothetical protein
MALNPDDPVLRTAVFGRQVEQFLDSDIGCYLAQCAEKDIELGINQLKKADPFKPEQVIAAQMKVKIAETIMGWLGDALRAGYQATEAIKEDVS